MKRIFTALVLLLVCSTRSAYAHKEWVHQYMVKEAYKYLENQIGTIPVLRDAVGLNYVGNGDQANPFNTPYPISIGSWREDMEDVVYGYTLLSDFTPSISHFWRADKGDNDRLNLDATPKTYENAWTKARVLLFCESADGPHEVIIPWRDSHGVVKKYAISYNSLPELYKGNFFLNYIEHAPNQRQDFNHRQIADANYLDNFPRAVALNLLGRVAHLLGDMSVPAHTHNHLHPCPLGFPDKYENHLGNTFINNNSAGDCEQFPGPNGLPAYDWTALTAAQQGPLLDEIYCQNGNLDQIRFLFYTLNQIADFFPSGVDPEDGSNGKRQYRVEGNADLRRGTNSHINAIYAQYNFTPPTSINVQNVGDATFNFAIRSVATLFQWFAYNAGITQTLTNDEISLWSNAGPLSPGQTVSMGIGNNISGARPNYGFPIWSIEPSSKVTEDHGDFSWFSYLNMTPNFGQSGLVTVKTQYYRTDGCYAGPVTLKRDFWIGGPHPYISYEYGFTNGEVCPGNDVTIGADVERPDLVGNVSYHWEVQYGSSTIASADGQSITFRTPPGYSQRFDVVCVATNSYGPGITRGQYITAGPNGIYQDGQYYYCSVAPEPRAANTTSKTTPFASTADIEVYPNPSDDQLTVVLPVGNVTKSSKTLGMENATYKLQDGVGRVVKSGKITGRQVQVDTGTLQAGMYTLSCSENGRTFFKKVQILH